MSTTPHLALPLIAAAQAQKHVTHNEALLALDALLHLAVLDKDLAAPPASPAAGARYIVGPAPTGAWAGRAGQIALRQDGAWRFLVPNAGHIAFVADEALIYVHGGAGWTPLTAALTAIQNLALLGVGTTADGTNPFSAKLNRALWTARTTGEGGDGDLRFVLNKETTADTLSLLLQTGFSGRLELGLLGEDRLSAKVSPDGTTWRTALSVDLATGGLDARVAETALASAATCDVGAAASLSVEVTGTAAITSFGTRPNAVRLLRFSGAATLTHHATSLVLPGGANLTTAAGDTALATSDASGNWRVRHYQRADGMPLALAAWATTTPSVTGSSANPTATTRSLQYRRDGTLLTFSATVAVTTVGSASGSLVLSAPFANAGLDATFAAQGFGGGQAAAYGQGYISAGDGLIYVANVNPWFAGRNVTVTGAYRVAP